jgi:hypothetical protein
LKITQMNSLVTYKYVNSILKTVISNKGTDFLHLTSSSRHVQVRIWVSLGCVGMWNISFIIMWPLHNQSYCNISMKNGSKSVPLLLCITLPSFSSIVIIVYVLYMFSEISSDFGTLCVTIIKELATMLYYYQGFRSSSFTTINRHLTFVHWSDFFVSYIK